MKTSGWLKPAVYGALIGASLVSSTGFLLGGWMTGGGATRMASKLAHEYTISALVPVCLDLVRTDPNRFANTRKVEVAVYYERPDAVMKAGWATVPGSDEANRDLAQACLASLKLNVS